VSSHQPTLFLYVTEFCLCYDADYALRRYPSDSSTANAHTANAWMALLDSAYGGNGSSGGSAHANTLKGACFEVGHQEHSCQACTAAKDLRCPSIWCKQQCIYFPASFGGHRCQPASVIGPSGPHTAPPHCNGNATGCGKCPASTAAVGATNAAVAAAGGGDDDTISTHHVNANAALGSADSDSFSKDGLARFPSLTLRLYKSPNTTGILYAWEELLAAAEADPTLEHSASFRYDLVDVVRQHLQNLFAATYLSLQTKCTGSPDTTQHYSEHIDGVSSSPGNYTEYPRANCDGGCLSPNTARKPNGASRQSRSAVCLDVHHAFLIHM
jgi:hypothetical protein